MKLLVKICGVTTVADTLSAVECGCDAIGLNFYRDSPRYVTPETARECVRVLPSEILPVGVFVNHSREEVRSIAETVGLAALQFSGDEDIAFCQGWESCQVIRTYRIGSTTDDAKQLEELAASVDTILFDSYSAVAYGGTGVKIPDDVLNQAPFASIIERSWLSGGLTPGNVQENIERYRPAGVDVASGVEQSPGVKDVNLIRHFIRAARAGEAKLAGSQ